MPVGSALELLYFGFELLRGSGCVVLLWISRENAFGFSGRSHEAFGEVRCFSLLGRLGTRRGSTGWRSERMSEVVLESSGAGHESGGMIFNASHLVFYLLELCQDSGKDLVVGLRAGG